VIGRQRFGRIAIANTDAAATAYTDQAIDQAWRAVGELLVNQRGTETQRFAGGGDAARTAGETPALHVEELDGNG
jgi:hypothetical protein